MERPVVAFWYEFASTYSYIAAMRAEAAAECAGVTLVWRPFLLGPIFAKNGWTTSPFNLFPTKGRYMWRDVERLARELSLPLVRPEPFPQNGLLAARIALIGEAQGWTPAFTRAVYKAEFGEGRDISDPRTLEAVLVSLGLPAALIERARTDESLKARLKAQNAEAERLGLFGAPSFVTPDGELFWGNDRLEHAFAWALARR